jgi:hypothetical protein
MNRAGFRRAFTLIEPTGSRHYIGNIPLRQD